MYSNFSEILSALNKSRNFSKQINKISKLGIYTPIS